MADFITLKTFQPESAKQVYDALVAAKTAFDKEEDYLYVLDTNALLKTYSFDSDSFNKLKKFFESNKGKIFATHTVEIEYIRNRESVSNSYAVVSKKKFVDAFNKIGGTIEALYSDPGFNYSYLMKDNKELCEKIKALHENYKTVSNDVANYEKTISEDNADAFKLECLEMIVKNVDFSTKLAEENQYPILNKEFEELHKKYKDERKNNKKITQNFPGCGEDNPQKDGDYIIFHEMMELAKVKGKNIMLLTNDVAKDDWVDKSSGKTFESYQIMFYAITGYSFVVHKYDDFLKDKIGIEAQILEESEMESDKYEDIFPSKSAMHKIMRAYLIIENRVCHFMNNIGDHDVTSLNLFWKKYRHCLSNTIYEKFAYIIKCRNFIMHPSLEGTFNIDYDRFDKAYSIIRWNISKILEDIESQLPKREQYTYTQAI